MTKPFPSPAWQRAVPALAVLLVCTMQARDLPAIWQADVYARSAPWLFLLWLIPLLTQWWREKPKRCWPQVDTLLLVAALGCALVGTIGSLNIALQAAFGLALGGQVSPRLSKLPWLIGILAWLPATGWLAMKLDTSVMFLRIGALAVSLGLSYRWWKGPTR